MSDPAAVLEKTGLRFKDPEALKDPEVIKQLAELDAALEANPLLNYNNAELNPARIHTKQLEFHAQKAGPLGIKLCLASNRSGKTVCGVVDDIIQLVDEELLPPHLKDFKKWHGPVKIWVGAPKNENHFNNTIPLFRRFLPKAALREGRWSKSFKSQPNPRIELANGSEVAFKTYDQDLDAWAGAEIHRVHWDEEPNGANAAALRNEARYRLVSTAGDEIVTMTPVLGAYSWVNEQVWEKRDQPNVFAVKMKIWDNPWNTKEVVEQIVEEAKEAGEEEYRTRIEAEFVHLGGLFFPEFREDKHVIDRVEPAHLKGQEIVIAIDPGRRRTGVVWLAFDKENDALVFDEYFPREAVVPDVAATIKQKNKEWGIADAIYVIDPSSRNQSAINADAVEAAYARAEIYCEHAQNKRDAGILEVKRRLHSDPPQLIFTRNCSETIKQVTKYAKDPKAQDEWAAVPQTDSVRFDLVDGVRYGVMARTWFFAEEEPKPKRPFDPYFQPSYTEERRSFPKEVAPLGPFS